MKSLGFFLDFVRIAFIFSLLIFPATNNFSQSGQGKQKSPETQTDQIIEPPQNKADFSKMEAYEYIEPVPLTTFLEKLNEFGGKGYRFKDMTQIPYRNDTFKSIILKTNFAGIVKLDEMIYEYRMLNVEEIADLSVALNRQSQEGFNFREIITYQDTRTLGLEDKDDPVSKSKQMLYGSPMMYNVILLEREIGKQFTPREFQVLKAGYGIGKNPSKKMQMLIDEAAKQNMFPLAAFMSRGFALENQKESKWKIADTYYGAILEKSVEKLDAPVQFVRANFQKDFEKRVNKLASEGFRMTDSRLTQAFMYKNQTASPSTVTYKWLDGGSKSLDENLSKLASENARFVGTALSAGVWADITITENLLILEKPTGEVNDHFEYKSLRMITNDPQGVLLTKSTALPDPAIGKFRQVVKEGYDFAKLYFADGKVFALFERRTLK